ncbi:class I SAM-dependent methyltransferase [Mycolicibacillus parakoreensis]|uniref:Class I SAM-dependent methyltransferase n=2 Tax=Mycobacteriaceae TaxID=1762 RepID=A0ABY3U067_9MYCO|nr:class I SAM-dependent methyltransferase [Mycolicibacillus parakoreensis]ULN52534.1 class I SAM-dependent methyltransferase [Mycolicibacillus parakoreensis]
MSQARDWEGIYRDATAPPWNLGEPQPELARLIEDGRIHGTVLDAGCGHAEFALAVAAAGHSVVGLDISATAVAAATAAAADRGLTTAHFASADLTDFGGYDGRFDTLVDSGLLHSLPADKRQGYLASIHRAAATGAVLYILAFAAETFGDDDPDRGGPHGFTAEELRATVAPLWVVDDVRPATVYSSTPGHRATADATGRGMMAGLLLHAHKPRGS